MSDGSELLHKIEGVLSEMKEQQQRASRNASLVNALSGHERRAGIWEPAPAGEGDELKPGTGLIWLQS